MDAWQTNVSPWASDQPSRYNSSGDGELLKAILSGFETGTFGARC